MNDSYTQVLLQTTDRQTIWLPKSEPMMVGNPHPGHRGDSVDPDSDTSMSVQATFGILISFLVLLLGLLVVLPAFGAIGLPTVSNFSNIELLQVLSGVY